MACGPFGPFRRLGPGETAPAGPLAATWFDELAHLYAVCARIGLHARAVDEMEFWEIASELGMAQASEDSTRATPSGAPKTAAEWHERGSSIIDERLKAAAQGADPPAWDDNVVPLHRAEGG